MEETRLNLIALTVFFLTLGAFLAPLLSISPFVPTVATVGILGLVTLDSWTWEGRGLTLLLDRFAPPAQRERIVHHEAGHFLAAYLLDIPITGYSLTAWEAWQQGHPGLGGVQFDDQALSKSLQDPQTMPLVLERLATVVMAGIAAEKLVYGSATGGESDRTSLRLALKVAGLSPTLAAQKGNWGLLQAKTLLGRHHQSYQALVTAMQARATIADCYAILEPLTKATTDVILS